MTRLAPWTIGAAALLGSLLSSAPSFVAPPDCATTVTNPVYIQAGDTQTNLLKNLGRALRDNTPNPITLVFLTSGSCSNIDIMYNHTAPIVKAMTYIPSIAEDPSWTPASTPLTCTPPAGLFPDVGNSAVFNSACTAQAAPATVHVTNGPVQAYVLAVPEVSSQTAITYEEAYFVFGFGMSGMIAPWTNVANMFIRTATKSTLITWADSIGVPVNKWQGGCGSGGGAGSGCDKSDQVVSLLQNSADPESAIGILGDEVYDADRAFLNVLAFRSKGQYAAYYPDSTATARDKQNIRDGHYTVWSPTIWMDNVDGGGAPTNANARYVVDMIAGHPVTPAPNFLPDVVVANVGLVPDCAMRVSRSFDGGPLSLYTPQASCTCNYEKTVNQFTSCATCDDTHACASGVCRNHLCEAN